MRLLFRTLLIWLMVLAVPAQGAAAAAMVYCGPNHHGETAATEASQTMAAERANHHGSAASVDAHHETAAQADDGNSATAEAAASVQGSYSVKQKCSACASCCSVSAILNTVVTIPASAATATVFSAVVPTVEAFAVGGPDRPPRIVLA